VTLVEELSNANKARWELARILLDNRVTGDIEELHARCVEVAETLVSNVTDDGG
jgi:hypothetical protein